VEGQQGAERRIEPVSRILYSLHCVDQETELRKTQPRASSLPQFLPQLVTTSCRIRPLPIGQVARSSQENTAVGPDRVGSVSGLISVRSEVQLLPGPLT
jgi:hypothetical protein